VIEGFLVLAPVGVISFHYVNNGWTSWRDLCVMWGAWFLGIVIISGIRGALPADSSRRRLRACSSR
jgi:hypothetical protein